MTSKAIMKGLAAEFPDWYEPDGTPREVPPKPPTGMLRPFAKKLGLRVDPIKRTALRALSVRVPLTPEVRDALAVIRRAMPPQATNVEIVRAALLAFAKSMKSD